MRRWRYSPTRDYDKGPLDRLRAFPRHPDLLVYAARGLTNLALRGFLRTYHRLDVRGSENLPRTGSFVMVANHASHLDALALLAALPPARIHHAFPAAAKDYFFTTLPAVILSTVAVNALPFDRTDDPRQSLATCRRLLEVSGRTLILFPEGTRSADGAIGRFKPGIGFLVAATEIPVVPCHLAGAFEAWPRGRALPAPRPLTLTIGPPLRFLDHGPESASAHRIAATLRAAVIELADGPGPGRRYSSSRSLGTRTHAATANPSATAAPTTTVSCSPTWSATNPAMSAPAGMKPKKLSV